MRHRVVQVGLGVRGKFHLRGLVENPEAYEIVGLCDLDPKKIEEAKAMFGLDVPAFTDAETMLRQTRPEVFVFVTHPNVRTQMVELAVRYGRPAALLSHHPGRARGLPRAGRRLGGHKRDH